MLTSAFAGRRPALKAVLLGTVAAAVCAVIATCASGPALAQASGKIPEFASTTFSWVALAADGRRNALYGDGWLDPPAGLRGPIKNHPDHPIRGNGQRDQGPITLAIGNYMDPILKPWAAEQMRKSNEEVLTGKRGMPFLATSRCYPGGVPGQLLWTTEPLFFIQQPKVVYMVWERDHMVRRIFLTDKHSEAVKPSWFGESIGRYENGELVVDTIGVSAHMNFLDMFRTPHTEKMRVTERFKLTDDGKFLDAFVKVEDKDTFNEPMYMAKRWGKRDRVWGEFICAENNSDIFEHNLFPMPEAKQPDF
jgi:hypothetical protein